MTHSSNYTKCLILVKIFYVSTVLKELGLGTVYTYWANREKLEIIPIIY